MDSTKCVSLSTHPFRVPQRGVPTVETMETWLRSEAYQEYLGFILTLNKRVLGVSQSVDCPASPVIQGLMDIMSKWSSWIDENRWFKVWYFKVKENCLTSLQEILPLSHFRAVPEILEYLTESFGSATRTDYGPGHELNFCMFLYCLYKIGALTEEDHLAVVCKVFTRYLKLVRKLQVEYNFQAGPNGGRGHWALDDHQFVAFIWGSSQLMDHPKIEPRSYLQEDMLNEYGDEYMFLDCIRHINQVKANGEFGEHSCQLWNLSAIGYWETINKCLINMYKKEILSKFSVVQHFLFGSLLTLTPVALPKLNVGEREIVLTIKNKHPEVTKNANDSKRSSDSTNP